MDSFLDLQFNPIDQHVCFCAKTTLFYLHCSVVQLEVRNGDSSSRSFIIQDLPGYPEVLVFPSEAQIFLSRSVKDFGILMRTALNLWIAFVRIALYYINPSDL